MLYYSSTQESLVAEALCHHTLGLECGDPLTTLLLYLWVAQQDELRGFRETLRSSYEQLQYHIHLWAGSRTWSLPMSETIVFLFNTPRYSMEWLLVVLWLNDLSQEKDRQENYASLKKFLRPIVVEFLHENKPLQQMQFKSHHT